MNEYGDFQRTVFGIVETGGETARQQFIGDLKQYPPKYSAIKIKGKRAFDYAHHVATMELRNCKGIDNMQVE